MSGSAPSTTFSRASAPSACTNSAGSWLFGRVTARSSTELRFLSEMLSPMKARARSAAFWPAASPSNR